LISTYSIVELADDEWHTLPAAVQLIWLQLLVNNVCFCSCVLGNAPLLEKENSGILIISRDDTRTTDRTNLPERRAASNAVESKQEEEEETAVTHSQNN
jgi:hypothetical protein